MTNLTSVYSTPLVDPEALDYANHPSKEYCKAVT
jgi:hypothetical protein